MGDTLPEWTDAQDWEALYEGVVSLLVEEGLSDSGLILRKPSSEAASQFAPNSIDLVHIDGNHDRVAVARDFELYRPLVHEDGFIVLDDISWDSVRPVYDELARSAILMEETRGAEDDYALFHLVNG